VSLYPQWLRFALTFIVRSLLRRRCRPKHCRPPDVADARGRSSPGVGNAHLSRLSGEWEYDSIPARRRDEGKWILNFGPTCFTWPCRCWKKFCARACLCVSDRRLRLAGKRELAQLNHSTWSCCSRFPTRCRMPSLAMTPRSQRHHRRGDAAPDQLSGGAFYLWSPGYRKARRRRAGGVDRQGKAQQNNLDQEAISIAALEEAAHKQGLASLDEIERAILEPGGAMTFIAKKQNQRHVVPRACSQAGSYHTELADLRTAFSPNMPE